MKKSNSAKPASSDISHVASDAATTKARDFRWLLKYAGWCAIFVPVLHCIYFVARYGVNVLWEDDWDTYLPLLEKWYAGTLGFADFWARHSEHRIPFCYFYSFYLILATGWNKWFDLWLTQAGFVAVLALLLYAVRKSCRPEKFDPWLAVPIALLVCSVRQHQTILFGGLHCFMVLIAGALTAFLCLQSLADGRCHWLKWSGALLGATIATFSQAQGLPVWPAGLIVIVLLAVPKREKLAWSGIWCLAATIEYVAYFWHYSKPTYHPDVGFSLSYFATIVGGSLLPGTLVAGGDSLVPFMHLAAAFAGGLILVLGALAVGLAFYAGRASRFAFWLAVLAFGLLIQFQVALGRSGFGPAQALSSRYATFSMLIAVGVYAILSSLCQGDARRLPCALWGSLVSLIMFGVCLSTFEGHQAGAQSRAKQEFQKYVVCTSDTQPDEVVIMGAGPLAPEIRKGIEFLKQHQMSIFATEELVAKYAVPQTPLPQTSAQVLFNLEPLAASPNSGLITAAGWAADAKTHEPVGGMVFEIDGVPYPAYCGPFPSHYGRAPGDYALRYDYLSAVLKAKGLRDDCGFVRVFSPKQFPPGTHTLVIRAMTKDRTAFYPPSATYRFTTDRQP